MKTLILKIINQDSKQRVEIEDYNIGDSWPEQFAVFLQFLNAQGFNVTYRDLLEEFGRMLNSDDTQ